MKTINVMPVESIRIKLKDREYICTFNMLSMAYMQECLANLKDVRLDEISPARMASFILYSGIKPNRDEFTLDEAEALAMSMGPSNYSDIIGEFNNLMYDSANEKDKDSIKKQIAQTLYNARK